MHKTYASQERNRFELRETMFIPNHKISSDEEKLSLDDLRIHLLHENHAQCRIDDTQLFLKLSGNRQARKPKSLLSDISYTFMLVSAQAQDPIYGIPFDSDQDGASIDPNRGRGNISYHGDPLGRPSSQPHRNDPLYNQDPPNRERGNNTFHGYPQEPPSYQATIEDRAPLNIRDLAVTVNLPHGSEIMILNSSTVLDLESMISNRNIVGCISEIKDQRLQILWSLRDSRNEKKETLSQLNVEPGSVIDVVMTDVHTASQSTDSSITVHLPSNDVEVKAHSSHTLLDLEKMLENRNVCGCISEVLDEKDDDRTIWKRDGTNDEERKKTLADLGLRGGSVISVSVSDVHTASQSTDSSITVHLPSNDVEVKAHSSHTLLDLEKMLENRNVCGCISEVLDEKDDDRTIWKRDGTNDEERKKTLADLGLRGGSVISVSVSGPPRPESFLHVQKGCYRRKFPMTADTKLKEIMGMVDVNSDCSLLDVRLKSKSLCKSVEGDISKCNMSLSDLNIGPGDVIDIIPVDSLKACTSFSWKVKSSTGFDLREEIDVGKGHNIADIKKAMLDCEKCFAPSDRHNLHLFEFRSISYKDEVRELYKPLYDIDKPPNLKQNDDDDPENWGYLKLWPHCKLIKWEDKMPFDDGFEWPWGEAEFVYWITGVEVIDKEKREQNIFTVSLYDGGLLNLHSGIEYKDLNGLRTCRKLQIERKRRKYVDFIAMITNAESVRIFNPNRSTVKIRERISRKYFKDLRASDYAWNEILKCDEFWVDCPKKEAEKLSRKWSGD